MAGDHERRQPVPQSLSATSRSLPALAWFRPFYAFRGHDLETVTGHLGGQFFLRGTDLFVAGGASYVPLGMRSSLLHSTRSPFMEVGTRRTLLSNEEHAVLLMGAYGYSEGGGMSAHVGQLSARYEHRFLSGTLALQAGYQRMQGRIGIPGWREANASPVPFTDHNPDVRISFSLGR